jgi:hypothetical protein
MVRNIMLFEYAPLTIKVRGNDQHLVDQQREATIAKGTGLAYLCEEDADGTTTYSVTHVKSGVSVCDGWVATSKQEAELWIAGLVEIADWTGPVPQAKDSLLTLLKMAIVGTLHEATRQVENEQPAAG